MIRSTRILFMPKGRFSSMLDMGGVASAKSNTKLDTGKNNKLRAIVLDFDLITRSVEAQKKLDQERSKIQVVAKSNSNSTNTKPAPSKESIRPNTNIIENIANLLNVKLGGDDTTNINNRAGNKGEREDDLSRLIGQEGPKKNEKVPTTSTETQSPSPPPTTISPPAFDIRTKYAAKLRSKTEGGLAGIELAKSKKEEALKQGDAAGHFAARSLAASNTVSTSGSKWLALTGTGSLLTYLNSRSMKIILLPLPTVMDQDQQRREQERMVDFTKQLPQVKFDLLMKGLQQEESSKNQTISNTDTILDRILSRVSIPQIAALVVSDRDDYLRAARDKGMFTCRVRRKNAPRGNVTTNYNVEEISEVEGVVNEVNGISFNTVFSQS